MISILIVVSKTLEIAFKGIENFKVFSLQTPLEERNVLH